ncbi:MAG: prepilin-type N-terminal cleavage/methylation domain-containing protein [Acidobacteria bacterium]|nr:prepilin-type N-terminal cleavage/methylation domain-containing protein [Acidobacteriota bacterium]
MRRTNLAGCDGYSFIELIFALAVVATLAGIAVPIASGTIDDIRASGAARHVAARIAASRLEAVRRSASVALRFDRVGSDYAFTPVLDGNGDGVRAADVAGGIDRLLARTERLGDQFANTSFGLRPGLPDLDGAMGTSDGVHIGSSSFLSVSPNGSSTGGTLYVQGRRSQYAVRVLGATGRVRLFWFDPGARRWITR